MSQLSFPKPALWIGSAHPFDLHEAYLCFRRTWQLEQSPEFAELLITADSRYKLWVNGQFVARGPARSFPQAQCVDRLDVASYLRSGPNTLAVQVYQPGYSHFAYVHRAAAGLLTHLTCDGETELVTDTSWRVRRDPSFDPRVPRVSIYGSGVEERNLDLGDGWTAGADYDDDGWESARVVAPVRGYPWTDLAPRPLPLLNERELPMTLVETRQGTSAGDNETDAHLTLRRGWFAANPHPVEASSRGWFEVALTEGESAFWLFDLGRGYTCQGWAEIEGAGGREQLLVSYAEKTKDDELVLSDPETYCRVRMTDRFRLRAGDQTAEPFAMRGGRYLVFQLTGPTSADCRLRLHARVAEYPLEISRNLSTSDPVLADIIALCENTFRACLLDGFTDTPWRENAQWVGDALPQSLIMAALSDDTRPLRRVIEMAAQNPYPDGVLPTVVPGEVHAYTVVDYNFVWIELLNLYWNLTEDEAFVAEMWPALVKLLDRFHQDLDADGLLVSQPGRRLFLDWAPLSRNEPNAVYNLHYLLALREAAALAMDRGRTEDAQRWQSRVDALRSAVRAAFWHAGRWYDDVERSTFSQLTAALAVLAGAPRPDEEAGLLDAIAARSLDPDDDFDPDKMVLASPFMHHYVFEALRQGGKSHAVVDIIRRRWGRWVEAGSPTAWENWSVDFPDGSQCHAFSAHPRYHLAEIAGEESFQVSVTVGETSE